MKKSISLLTISIQLLTSTIIFSDIKIKPPKWTPLTNAEKETSKNTHLKYESEDPIFIYYRGFVVNYDLEKRRVNWVVHKVTPSQIYRENETAIKRKDYDFKFFPDTTIENKKFRVKTEEYTNTGWDRGHFAPAADFKYDLDAMTESHVTTNITPQSVDLNQDLWVSLEMKIRSFIKDTNSDAYIITGAIYNNNLFRKCKNNQKKAQQFIYVPVRFYKVIYTKFQDNDYLYCFLINHSLYYSDKSLVSYQVTLDEIEILTGENFFDKLPLEKQTDIESKKMNIDIFLANN